MAKKILVVVDAQNDFITGVLGNKECDVATNVIAEEIRSEIGRASCRERV